MNLLLLIITLLISPNSYKERVPESIKDQLRELEEFMRDRIPANHMSVVGYQITLDECILTKVTLVDDGTSHSVLFDLNQGEIGYSHEQMDDKSAEVYGFKDYWDVDIDGSWVHSEILIEKDAIIIVNMLKEIQESCK